MGIYHKAPQSTQVLLMMDETLFGALQVKEGMHVYHKKP